MKDYAGLLYAKPSFWEGVARAFDIGGVFTGYNTSPSEAEADWMALASDWYAVGADLDGAIARFEAETRTDRSGSKPYEWVDSPDRERQDAVATQPA